MDTHGNQSRYKLLLLGLLSLFWLGCGAPVSPTLDISLDASEYAPGAKLKLSITVTSFLLSQDNVGKANQAGMGHYRVYLDGKKGDDFIEEGAQTSLELTLPQELAPGNHGLRVVLLNNDNTPLATNVEETKFFTIKDTAGPSISLQADKTTVKIGDVITLTLDIKNYKLVPISAEPVNKEGEGHYHIAFDNADPEQDYLKSSTKTTFDLTIPDDANLGKRTLWVYLMKNNHTKLTPEVKSSLEIEILPGTSPTIKATASATEFDPGDALTLDMEVKNFKLVDPKTNTEKKLGEGHYRVAVDDADPSKEFLIKGFNERAEVALPTTITPGPHKLVVHLVNSDGTALDPPVSSTINISIKGGAIPKVTVKASVDSLFAGETINLQIKTEDFKLIPISNTPKNAANEGHYHVVLDDQDPEKAYVVFGAKENPSVTIPTGTAPGPHKLWIYLMNNDHSLYVPLTKVSLDFTIKSGTEPALTVSLDNTELVEGGKFNLNVKTFNFTLKTPKSGDPNSPNEGHYHTAFDDDDPEKDYAMATAAEKVEGTLPSRIKAGKHILWVYLMYNDHTLLKPQVRNSVTFTVKAK